MRRSVYYRKGRNNRVTNTKFPVVKRIQSVRGGPENETRWNILSRGDDSAKNHQELSKMRRGKERTR